MRPKFQSKQAIIINAPLKKVWNYLMDITNIPEFHPRVANVDLLSNQKYRGENVVYQCHLSDGKNSCVEKDVEIIPMKKIVTELPSDTMGLTKLLNDYVVETTFEKVKENQTKVEMLHYYSSSKFKVWLMNFIIKPKISKETFATLQGIKKSIENENIY